MKQLFCVTATILSLTACTVGPDFEQPTMQVDSWVSPRSAEQQQATNITWWQVFNDPMLDELIQQVATSNLDIATARQRVLEARAMRGVARSSLLPSIGSSGGYSRRKLSENDPNFIQAPGVDISQIQNVYDAGFDASWEVDLFGGNRRALESATATLEGIEALRRSVVLSVLAETARHYVELRSQQKQIALLRRNAELQQETLTLVKASYDSGLSRNVDVTRAKAQLANTEALIPNIEADIRATSYQIAVLTGQQPGALWNVLKTSKPLPAPQEVVPLGLKSDLLRQRPDIQRAEKNLAAATADVGVAVARLYPSFNITGGIGFLAADTGDLFESASETFLFSPFINFPIFEGGRLRAQIKAAEARNSIAAIAYEQTVLNALAETESALIRYAKEQETRVKRRDAVEASKQSVQQINALYEQGLTQFINVLDAERVLTESQQALVQSETQALTKLITVYKSLGGGWQIFEGKTPDKDLPLNRPGFIGE